MRVAWKGMLSRLGGAVLALALAQAVHAAGDEEFLFFRGEVRDFQEPAESVLLGTLEGEQARPLPWFAAHQPTQTGYPRRTAEDGSTAPLRLKWEALDKHRSARTRALGRVRGKALAAIVISEPDRASKSDIALILLRQTRGEVYEPLLVRFGGVIDFNDIRPEQVRTYDGIPAIFVYTSVYRAGGFTMAVLFPAGKPVLVEPMKQVLQEFERLSSQGWEESYHERRFDLACLQVHTRLVSKREATETRLLTMKLRLTPRGLDVASSTVQPEPKDTDDQRNRKAQEQ